MYIKIFDICKFPPFDVNTNRSAKKYGYCHLLSYCTKLLKLLLHGPPMLVDETSFGLVLYKHTNFYRFEKSSSYWSVKQISFFSAFHWSTSDTPPASQCITVE